MGSPRVAAARSPNPHPRAGFAVSRPSRKREGKKVYTAAKFFSAKSQLIMWARYASTNPGRAF